MTRDITAAARQSISLLDLTDLSDGCQPGDIEALCMRAATPFGPVAAICIWPRFVAHAVPLLAGSGIRIATVVNFPAGDASIDAVVAETQAAIRDGADEIDLVLPYRRFLAGDRDFALAMVTAIRKAAGPATLKVILETGELAREPGGAEAIREASRLAIAGGADFIKTSTGKVAVNATPEAARIMLEIIRQSGRRVGLKPAGGVRTTADAMAYLDLAADIMGPQWAQPATFRFGASAVLNNLLAAAAGGDEGRASGY